MVRYHPGSQVCSAVPAHFWHPEKPGMAFREIEKRAVYFVPALYVRLFWSKRRQEDLLAMWQLPLALTFLERIIFKPYLEHWVHHTYLKEIDPDRREGLKGV